MLAFSLLLADGVTIKLGDHVWSFGLNFILYLIIAAIVGIAAEAITRSRLPFGFVGAIIAALIGVWLMTNVILIQGLPEVMLFGVPIIKALIGAILLVLVWRLIASLFTRRRAYR